MSAAGVRRRPARFVVGIDLGTTNTVIASASIPASVPSVFPVEQHVSAQALDALPLLPSTLYAPLPAEGIDKT